LTVAEYLLPRIEGRYCGNMDNSRWSVRMANSRTVFEQVINLRWTGRGGSAARRVRVRAGDLILREPGSGARMALEDGLDHAGVDVQQLNVWLV
jgi:hypothetical protein